MVRAAQGGAAVMGGEEVNMEAPSANGWLVVVEVAQAVRMGVA